MSTDTPPTTKITLTYEDGHWVAKDIDHGVTVEAATREDALEALDAAIEGRCDHRDIAEIGPDDPFFSAPTFSSGTADVSENVDEYLTAADYRDAVDPDDAA